MAERSLARAYDGHYSARYGIIYEVRTAGAIIQRHLHPNKHSDTESEALYCTYYIPMPYARIIRECVRAFLIFTTF